MRIGICDDEKTARTESREICQTVLQYFGETPEIIEFSDGRDVLHYPKELDILILDIELSDMNSIAVKQHLEYRNSNTLIIFLTNHSELVYDGYGKNTSLTNPEITILLGNAPDNAREALLAIPDNRKLLLRIENSGPLLMNHI